MPLFVYMFFVYLLTLEDPVGLRDLNLTHGRNLIDTLSESEHGYTTVHAEQPLKSPVEESITHTTWKEKVSTPPSASCGEGAPPCAEGRTAVALLWT